MIPSGAQAHSLDFLGSFLTTLLFILDEKEIS